MSRQTLKTWYGYWWTTAVPAAWETEAGGAWVWGQPGLHKVLSPRRKRTIKHQTVIWEGVVVLRDWGLASEPLTSSSSASPKSTRIFISWFLCEGIYTELKGPEDGRDGAQSMESSTFVTSGVNQKPRYHFRHGGQGRSLCGRVHWVSSYGLF